jgi:hypothetical protein
MWDIKFRDTLLVRYLYDTSYLQFDCRNSSILILRFVDKVPDTLTAGSPTRAKLQTISSRPLNMEVLARFQTNQYRIYGGKCGAVEGFLQTTQVFCRLLRFSAEYSGFLQSIQVFCRLLRFSTEYSDFLNPESFQQHSVIIFHSRIIRRWLV